MAENTEPIIAYAKNVLKKNFGITKPPKEYPLNKNSDMAIWGMIKVSTYKITIFTRNDANPNVTRLRGRATRERTGFRISPSIIRTKPP